MTPLAKILFIADMTERGREFDGVEELRKIAEDDLEKGFLSVLSHKADYVKNSDNPIFGLTEKTCKYHGIKF